MEGDVGVLDEELRALKRSGANVLVLTDASQQGGCAQLLGADTELRRRLFVRTGDPTPTPRYRTGDPTRFGRIDVPCSAARTTVADAEASTPELHGVHGVVEPVGPAAGRTRSTGPNWYSNPGPKASLATVARHVHVHLSRFEACDPAPGEIRVCVDSLDAYVDAVPETQLRRFVSVVGNCIRQTRGIGHFHLSQSADARRREELEALVDVTVEVRPSADGTQQQWTLHESGLRTNWLQF